MQYSESQAETYRRIGLEGTTFEVGVRQAVAAIGTLAGLRALDFGTGAGRTARVLREAGAQHVVAVDKDPIMLRAALSTPGVSYLQTGAVLPLADNSIDKVLAANVFCEFERYDEIVDALREVHRVLVGAGILIVIAANPESIGLDYVSYRYLEPIERFSGSPIRCFLKGDSPTVIQDYFWPLTSYSAALEAAGFEIQRIDFPLASEESHAWLNETRVAADMIICCKRRNKM